MIYWSGTGNTEAMAQAVAEAIGLENVACEHRNVVEERARYDYVVSRAVMTAPELVKLIRKNVHHEQHNALPNGLLCLKGGDLEEELRPFGSRCDQWDLSQFFEEPFFETKKAIYITL